MFRCFFNPKHEPAKNQFTEEAIVRASFEFRSAGCETNSSALNAVGFGLLFQTSSKTSYLKHSSSKRVPSQREAAAFEPKKLPKRNNRGCTGNRSEATTQESIGNESAEVFAKVVESELSELRILKIVKIAIRCPKRGEVESRHFR